TPRPWQPCPASPLGLLSLSHLQPVETEKPRCQVARGVVGKDPLHLRSPARAPGWALGLHVTSGLWLRRTLLPAPVTTKSGAAGPPREGFPRLRDVVSCR